MLIRNKTRNISKKIKYFKQDEQYFICIDANEYLSKLKELGFTIPLQIGERILPSSIYGIACKRNADGDEITHKDRPKETVYRQAEWRWTQFCGRYDREEMSKIVDIPYKRYPRTELEPFGVELVVTKGNDNKLFIVSGPFKNKEEEIKRSTNTVNMFIELFSECMILDLSLSFWNGIPVKRLNWELLPSGENPWKNAQPSLRKFLDKLPDNTKIVIDKRFESIGSHIPEFVAIGKGGFENYVVFGFPAKKFCILESNKTNNATYILSESSWYELSQLSKGEILCSNLHKARLIHRTSWFYELNKLFTS